MLFAMLTSLPAASVTLAWDPSSGTGVVGYKIYYGPASRTYTNSLATGNVTNATIDNLVAGGSYFFAATAVTAGGVESAFSNEIQYQVAQNTPTNYIVTLSNLDQVYDGMTKPVTVAPVPPGASVVVTYNGVSQPPTAAGDYLVVASVVSTNGLFSATNMLMVGQAPAAVSLGLLAQVYDGSPKPVTATTQPANLSLAITYNGSATVPKSAGSYAVIAAVNDGNHVGGATNTLVISKAQASVMVTNAVQGFIYDGKSKQFVFTTSPAGLPTTVTYAGKSTTPTFIGNYPVVITISDPTTPALETGRC